ncbi:S9 family peptidase [Pedobacter caeni]|uniref:Prolyl oligopeptidase family protein n=1 Tax=Pedobacter caeni TaxID=288992 RepID=A0A1M5G1D2_9SPHI|nr:DPP IV N-terminal domain-containing protein [Pedobacter caeni]SHF97565.1 Prolyl oligopeptidase family protein [Pedobacter caeni]
MNKLRLSILACLLAGRLSAQTAVLELAEKYSGDQLGKYVKSGSVSLNWVDKSAVFYYTDSSGPVPVCYLGDAKKGSLKPLYDTRDLAKELSKIRGENTDPKELSFYNLEINPKNPENFNFLYKGKRYQYLAKGRSAKEIPKISPPQNTAAAGRAEYWKKFSPDSNWFTYGYQHNVYLQKRSTDTALRLTLDGAPYYSFTSSNSAITDDKKSSPSVYWFKGSNKFFALREDKRRVQEMSIINSLATPRPQVNTYKFPMPGDKEVVQYELFLFDAAAGKATKLDISKYPDQKIIMQSTITNGRTMLHGGGLSENERYVYFLRRSRTNEQMDLCRLDSETGKVTELITETSKPHFNDQLFNCRILNNGNDILWWSERTGYGQYYLYDRNGKLKNAITSGKFVSGEILKIDTAGRSLIFEGYGREKGIDPYYRMFYKVKFDGSDFRLLSPGNGHHDISLSSNAQYLTDTYSRMDQPAVTVLRDMKGRQLMELAKEDISALLKTGWKKPELLKVKAADGITDLYGVIYKPFNLDTNKKYPIITNVYPGPQEDFIPRKFTLDDNYNQSLAQMGFIVINVGYRGSSPLRGRDFYTFGYGNLRDYALADDKYVIENLAKTHAYIDLNKVGIYGHSGGGFMTATAILTYPDFYKVAVAASGNYDSNIYTQWWGETYHGVWQQKDGFESNIPVTAALAGNLKGKLFLITGDVDKNVHPANTFRLADALIKKNKRFDMMVLPGKDHGLGDKYYTNLIRYYFLENLLKIKNDDTDIVSHQ